MEKTEISGEPKTIKEQLAELEKKSLEEKDGDLHLLEEEDNKIKEFEHIHDKSTLNKLKKLKNTVKT